MINLVKRFFEKFNPKILLIISCAFLIIFNIVNINQELFEQHPFRQTQTALTAYYLVINGFSFNYETPVIGYPWSVPFEFPIYQMTVALFNQLLPFSLTSTGRLVSLVYFLLTLFPIFNILKIYKINNNAIFFALAFYVTTPIYIFWSFTFMIETTALFFSLCFLYYAIKIINYDWKTKNILLASLCLLLGLLQKITTIFPISIFVFIVFFISTLKLYHFKKNKFQLVLIIFFALLPFLFAYLWITYTDYLKNLNEIGSALTSEKLRGWNFGRLHLRYSSELYDVILKRTIRENSIFYLGLFAIFYVTYKFKNSTILKINISSILLFLLPFYIFTKLHIVHNYYQTANLVFLSITMGLSFYIIIEKINLRKFYKNFLLVFLLTINLIYFVKDFGIKRIQFFNHENNRTLAVSTFIKNNTSFDDSIIAFGFDWSSELAFYSERKSLSLPWGKWDYEALVNTKKFLGPNKLGAIVNCPHNSYNKNYLDNKKNIENIFSFSQFKIWDCDIYLKN